MRDITKEEETGKEGNKTIVEEPEVLGEIVIEELSIDGVCGVY
jgi:mycofactocin precursor